MRVTVATLEVARWKVFGAGGELMLGPNNPYGLALCTWQRWRPVSGSTSARWHTVPVRGLSVPLERRRAGKCIGEVQARLAVDQTASVEPVPVAKVR